MHRLAVLALAAAIAAPALAQEAVIRKNLAERLPDFPKIDEVNKSPIPGLYEVRVGTEIFYTDEQGNHIIDGSVIETRTRTNLTQARIDKLTQIDFAKLPLKDAIVWKSGTGERKGSITSHRWRPGWQPRLTASRPKALPPIHGRLPPAPNITSSATLRRPIR